MAMNRIQFQPGLSLPAFYKLYGTEAQCAAALEKARWPTGFSCPRCDGHQASRSVGAAIPCFSAVRVDTKPR